MFKIKTVRLIAGYRIFEEKSDPTFEKKTGFGSDFEKKQDPDQTPQKELDLDLTLEKIRNDIDLLLFPHIKVNINHISTLGLKNTRIRIRPYFESRSRMISIYIRIASRIINCCDKGKKINVYF